MAIPRTDDQVKQMKKYNALKREWKKKGIQIGVFDFVAQKIIIEMKPDELAKRIREQIG
jgi:hypothetical protein